MKLQLLPHNPEDSKALAVEVTCRGQKEYVSLHFHLRGSGVKQLAQLDEFPLKLQRKEALWKSTCFECFVYQQGQEQYQEWNVSPLGFWNTYEFESYRLPSPPSKISNLPPQVRALRVQADEYQLEIELHRKTHLKASRSSSPLYLRPTLVFQLGTELSYWSASHPSSRPDFHLPLPTDFKLTLS